ncbi:hypothetical protein QAD02_015774, partial [Eretmocerus hayati]
MATDDPEAHHIICLLVKIFFKALGEAGSVGQMQAELKLLDDSSDELTKGFTSDGEFSSYKSLYSLPIRSFDLDDYAFSIGCANAIVLVALAKHSKVFKKSYDYNEMKKLRKNDEAVFVGALLLKFCLDISSLCVIAKLIDPSENNLPKQDDVRKDLETLIELDKDKVDPDSSVPLVTRLITGGCVPNVQICPTFGNKFILHALQPIKAGSQ